VSFGGGTDGRNRESAAELEGSFEDRDRDERPVLPPWATPSSALSNIHNREKGSEGALGPSVSNFGCAISPAPALPVDISSSAGCTGKLTLLRSASAVGEMYPARACPLPRIIAAAAKTQTSTNWRCHVPTVCWSPWARMLRTQKLVF
jgi:hypothetical protein